jgi:hypothetical protein
MAGTLVIARRVATKSSQVAMAFGDGCGLNR